MSRSNLAIKLSDKQKSFLIRAADAGSEGIIVDGGRLRTATSLVRRGLLQWVIGSGGYRVVITNLGRARASELRRKEKS